MAGPAETHPVPGSAALAPRRDAGSLGREPRGHPLPAPTWTRGLPPPNPEPNPRGRRGRLEGEGKQTSSPGKITAPTPRGSEKALRRGTTGRGELPLGILRENVLALDYHSEPLTSPPPSRAMFPTPGSTPLAFQRNVHRDLANARVRPANVSGLLGPARLPQPPGIDSRALPPFPVASTCHRPAHAALLPALGHPPVSHLLPAAHSAYSPIRRLAPTPSTTAADSTARIRAGAPSRRRRESVSPSPARRHLGPRTSSAALIAGAASELTTSPSRLWERNYNSRETLQDDESQKAMRRDSLAPGKGVGLARESGSSSSF